MRRGLKSNTSIGSSAPVNFFKSGDSPMSRNPIKIWEIKIDSGRRKWPDVPLNHHVPAVFAARGTVANFATACSLWHARPANPQQLPNLFRRSISAVQYAAVSRIHRHKVFAARKQHRL